MSNRLFDPNDLVQVEFDDEENSKWTIGYDLPDESAAYYGVVSDPCNTGAATTIAGTVDANPLVYFVQPFMAMVGAKRNVRCSSGEELEIARALLAAGGAVAAAEYALWYGVGGWDSSVQPSLSNTDVATVATAAGVADTIAAAVVKYASLTLYPNYVVHLGVKAAMDLSATGNAYADNADPSNYQFRLRATDAPIVVSPYYPAAGVAVSGPIRVRVGAAASWQEYDVSKNRTAIRGYQPIAIELDPSTAVRAV